MPKIKVVPNYKKKPNQQMAEYWKTFNAGRDHERKIAIEYFISRIEELKQVEGVGEKTFNKIMEFVNQKWS